MHDKRSLAFHSSHVLEFIHHRLFSLSLALQDKCNVGLHSDAKDSLVLFLELSMFIGARDRWFHGTHRRVTLRFVSTIAILVLRRSPICLWLTGVVQHTQIVWLVSVDLTGRMDDESLALREVKVFYLIIFVARDSPGFDQLVDHHGGNEDYRGTNHKPAESIGIGRVFIVSFLWRAKSND